MAKEFRQGYGVDPEVKPLVQALNQVGLQTIGSCYGHPDEYFNRSYDYYECDGQTFKRPHDTRVEFEYGIYSCNFFVTCYLKDRDRFEQFMQWCVQHEEHGYMLRLFELRYADDLVNRSCRWKKVPYRAKYTVTPGLRMRCDLSREVCGVDREELIQKHDAALAKVIATLREYLT